MGKYDINVQTRKENITQGLRTEFWITKAKDTKSGNVTLTAKIVFAVPHKTVTRTACLVIYLKTFFALNITKLVGV